MIKRSIFLHNYFEKIAGSTPYSAHPPTPSATAIIFDDNEAASSPPFLTF
jgi:hypothetical protein